MIIDDLRALVTSANFTEAAQERNIEAGLDVADPSLAAALRYRSSRWCAAARSAPYPSESRQRK